MHILHSAPVRPELREYVRAYAQREVDWSGEDLVQPIPASLEHVLEFEFAKPPEVEYPGGKRELAYLVSVVGAHSCPGISLHLNGRIESFAIFFQPLGMWQLFRIPLCEFTNRGFDARGVIGKVTEDLWLLLAECASFEQRVVIVERYLLWRAAKASGRTSVMRAAMHLFQHQGMSRIDDLAHHSGLSVRQFERRFAGDMGMAPKLFARITRFQMALDVKLTSPHRTWLAIAHDFGYHDQMHMIRDFQGLSGASPGQILIELGDTRPPALAASHPD